jgi:hypothetical protein
MSIRTSATLIAALVGAGACGGDRKEPEQTAPSQSVASDWTARYVRGSSEGLSKAKASGRGAMLVVSASW